MLENASHIPAPLPSGICVKTSVQASRQKAKLSKFSLLGTPTADRVPEMALPTAYPRSRGHVPLRGMQTQTRRTRKELQGVDTPIFVTWPASYAHPSRPCKAKPKRSPKRRIYFNLFGSRSHFQQTLPRSHHNRPPRAPLARRRLPRPGAPGLHRHLRHRRQRRLRAGPSERVAQWAGLSGFYIPRPWPGLTSHHQPKPTNRGVPRKHLGFGSGAREKFERPMLRDAAGHINRQHPHHPRKRENGMEQPGIWLTNRRVLNCIRLRATHPPGCLSESISYLAW